jgi:hypothetical protein
MRLKDLTTNELQIIESYLPQEEEGMGPTEREKMLRDYMKSAKQLEQVGIEGVIGETEIIAVDDNGEQCKLSLFDGGWVLDGYVVNDQVWTYVEGFVSIVQEFLQLRAAGLTVNAIEKLTNKK